jgi:cholinesterase
VNRVKTYISLFGGDPDNITVLGHSAGGGSVIHHITAYGGEHPDDLPFQRAIIQSPGWELADIGAVYDNTLAVASEISGQTVTDGGKLAALDFEILNTVNQAIVFASSNGSFTFGPTVDDNYVPGIADVLLLEDRFDSSPELMIGHNKNEAGMFVSPDLDSEEDMLAGLQHMFVNYRDDSVNYILRELYPPPGDTHSLYSTHYERACLIVSEGSFACHTRALAVAFENSTFNYRFDVPPAFHMQDLGYTFYNGENKSVEGDMAETMQMYFTTFAKSGRPNYAGSSSWPEYGEGATLVTFGKESVGTTEDDAKNARCEYWQSGEYWR